jgi:outer membrane protein OmpA-like peptidoglycan-associated protein
MVPKLGLVAVALAMGVPATAQETSSPAAGPSVEGYLCTFAGKCDGVAAAQPEIDAPETKGFRLARPSAAAAADSGGAATRAPAARRPAAAPAAYATRGPVAAPAGRLRAQPARLAATAAASAPGARPRADLLIGFDLNSAELSAEGRRSAEVFARSLLRPELAGTRFVVEGHTDLRGGRAVNRSLSQRRARAVVDYLAAQGVDRGRFVARGDGPDRPRPGHAATDPANRRVEAELLN